MPGGSKKILSFPLPAIDGAEELPGAVSISGCEIINLMDFRNSFPS